MWGGSEGVGNITAGAGRLKPAAWICGLPEGQARGKHERTGIGG